MKTFRTDIAVIGGGLGGCAAALAAARSGCGVILTEATRWIGGQLTSEAVPPDEHRWIEELGSSASYRALRRAIRDYYRSHTPLTPEARARPDLNPGNGWVSRLCHDPRVALAALHQLMAPWLLNGRLSVMHRHVPIRVDVEGDRVRGVVLRDVDSGLERGVEARLFVDATPVGDLLALAGVEHVVGAEARSSTGEPHAAERADPRAQQATTFCFALEHLPGEDHTIERPARYAFWRDLQPPGWPGRLLDWTTERPETHTPLTRHLFEGEDGRSLWRFRRILDRTNFEEGFAHSDITLVNWPQHDYWLGPIAGVSEDERARNLQEARQLSASFLYWLQTEAPRADGGVGYPGLRIRGDVVGGTPDGLAQAPYIRESRRLIAELTVREQHIAYPLRPHGPEIFADTVGVGCYRIDLHPRVGGAGYLDLGCWPFQIPLGAMIPVRVENVLPGGKNLGVTHVANGAFRVHQVEWSVGEAAGALGAFCLERKVAPRSVRSKPGLLEELQGRLLRQGVELSWPVLEPM